MNLLTDKEKEHIRRTWGLVERGALMETATKLFYDDLFGDHPDYRKQFPKDMDGQIKKLADTLNFAVKALDWDSKDWQGAQVDHESDLFVILTAMGRRHHLKYRVTNDQYGPVGKSLLTALDLGLGVAFTDEVRAAWTKLYTLIAQTMQLGAVMRMPGDARPGVQGAAQ